MANFGEPVITAKGLALQAKVNAGKCNFAFTKMRTSSVAITGETATSLPNIKQESVIASVEVVNDYNVKVSTAFDNTKLTEGYYAKTLGIYAADPDEGEILYCYVSAETADYIPPFNGIGTSSLLVDIVIAVSDSTNVNLTVTPSAYATVTQVINLQNDLNDVKNYIGYGYDSIWGVEVDYKNNKITRLGAAEGLKPGADFDNFKPWQRERVLMTSPAGLNFDYRIDNVMVKQPVFYTKVIPLICEDAASGVGKQLAKVRYYISDIPIDGFKVNEAFKDANGNIQDFIYLSAYEGCIASPSYGEEYKDDEQLANFDTDVLCSLPNAKPASGTTQNLSITNARNLAVNNGTGWCLHNIFALSVTQMLMLIEYATFDCQTAIGKGVCKLTDDGSTNMAVVTGATADLGNSSGNASGTQTDNGTYSVSYRGEENLWGSINTWVDGITISANDNCAYKIGDYSFNAKTVDCGDNAAFISRFGYDIDYPYLFLPTEMQGTSVNPVSAIFSNRRYVPNAESYCHFGGWWQSDVRASAWTYNFNYSPKGNARFVGARLLYVPQSASSVQEG